MTTFYDIHCHLDFCDNCAQIASSVSSKIVALNATVFPSSFVSARAKLETASNITVGLGLHPWEVANGRVGEAEIASFENLVHETKYVAEIGLDFYKDRLQSKDRQLEVLTRLFQAIKDAKSSKVVFLHAVKSTSDTLKMIDAYKLTDNNTLVFHWFQGTEDELSRAIEKGCMFSAGLRMANSDKGRDLIAKIPDDRLLIESDSPAHLGEAWSADEWVSRLEETYNEVAIARGQSREKLDDIVKQNSLKLLR